MPFLSPIQQCQSTRSTGELGKFIDCNSPNDTLYAIAPLVNVHSHITIYTSVHIHNDAAVLRPFYSLLVSAGGLADLEQLIFRLDAPPDNQQQQSNESIISACSSVPMSAAKHQSY